MIAGVDIGGTSTSAVIVTADGTVLAERSVPTPRGGVAMMRAATGLVTDLMAQTGTTVDAVGFGVAGVVDPQARRVVAASDSFDGWAGFDIGGFVDDTLGIPNGVDNDVNAYVSGQMRWGAGRGEDSVVALTLGTGVGGALWLDGGLYRGSAGGAGELGHVPSYVVPGHPPEPCTCGQFGHLESIASGRSIARRYRERTGMELSARQIAQRSDDPDASAVFAEAGAMIGRLAITMVGVLDVTTLIVGGSVAAAWPLMEPAATQEIAAAPPVSGRIPSLRLGTLGSHAVAIGAAALAR